MHSPFRQPQSARGVRKSPLHDRRAQRGACFGEIAVRRARQLVRARRRSPRVSLQLRTAELVRVFGQLSTRPYVSALVLPNQSSFAKFAVVGADAEAVLNRVCAGDVAVPVGKNRLYAVAERTRGIEADVTVTREADDQYLVVTACANQTRDLHWLRSHIPVNARAVVIDISSRIRRAGSDGSAQPGASERAYGRGPFQRVIPLWFFAPSGLGLRCNGSSITYVGELGWELYIGSEFAQSGSTNDELVRAGADYGLAHAGYHALNSLRMEKAYRHWGHDIGDEDTPLEAGLGFAVA